MPEQVIGYRYLADGSHYPIYGGRSDPLVWGGDGESLDGGLLVPEDAPDLAVIVERHRVRKGPACRRGARPTSP